MAGIGLPGTAALVAAVLALAAAPVCGQDLRPLAGSVVTLSGSTNVSEWRCTFGAPIAGITGMHSHAAGPEGIEIRLPLSAVTCGSRGMEADLRHALRAVAHPSIIVRPLRIDDSSGGIATTDARVEVAGIGRSVTLPVHWVLDGRRLRLRGGLPLRMTDFDVTPPRAMLGLVRARDEVLVTFDVVVELPADEAAALAAARNR